MGGSMKYLLMALTMVSLVACTGDDLSGQVKSALTGELTKSLSKNYGKSKFTDSFSNYIIKNTNVEQLSINEAKTEAKFKVTTLSNDVMQGIGTIAAFGGVQKDSTVDDLFAKMNDKQRREIASAKKEVKDLTCPLAQKDGKLSVVVNKCK